MVIDQPGPLSDQNDINWTKSILKLYGSTCQRGMLGRRSRMKALRPYGVGAVYWQDSSDDIDMCVGGGVTGYSIQNVSSKS